jgi:hypothetical protein
VANIYSTNAEFGRPPIIYGLRSIDSIGEGRHFCGCFPGIFIERWSKHIAALRGLFSRQCARLGKQPITEPPVEPGTAGDRTNVLSPARLSFVENCNSACTTVVADVLVLTETFSEDAADLQIPGPDMTSTTTGGKRTDDTQASIYNVLIWSGEDSPDETLIPQFTVMGGDQSRLFFLSTVDIGNGERRQFDPSKDMAAYSKPRRQNQTSAPLVEASAIKLSTHPCSDIRRLQTALLRSNGANPTILIIVGLSEVRAGRSEGVGR